MSAVTEVLGTMCQEQVDCKYSCSSIRGTAQRVEGRAACGLAFADLDLHVLLPGKLHSCEDPWLHGHTPSHKVTAGGRSTMQQLKWWSWDLFPKSLSYFEYKILQPLFLQSFNLGQDDIYSHLCQRWISSTKARERNNGLQVYIHIHHETIWFNEKKKS